MASFVDNAVHRVGHHLLRRVKPKHRQGQLQFCLRREPFDQIIFFEDHRHTIMNWLHQFVGRGGNDGHGLDDLSLLSFPVVPDAGQGKDLICSRAHEIGLFARSLAAPLIEPASRDDATAVAHRSPEGWPGLDPLGTGVYEQVLGLGFFGPE